MKQEHIVILSFLLTIAAMLAVRLSPYNELMNTGIEKALGIPFNVHHLLDGIILMAASGSLIFCFKKYQYAASIFFAIGAGLVLEHIVFEGYQLITPLV